VIAYYYLVIFEGRHGGAIREELRRVFDGALPRETQARQELMRLTQHRPTPCQGCHKPIARSPSATADSPNVRKNATLWTLSPAKSTVCTLKDLQTVPRD
jgi:hypothetical protein